MGPNDARRIVQALVFLLPSYYLILNRFLLPIQVVNYEVPNTQRDPKLEIHHISSFRSSTTILHHYHQQDKQGLETHHVSSLGKSYFLLYYFINNSYFYRQNYYSITVVSRRLPHKASIDINKEQGGGKVRRQQGREQGLEMQRVSSVVPAQAQSLKPAEPSRRQPRPSQAVTQACDGSRLRLQISEA